MSNQELPQDPDAIRREIEATRGDMDRTLAELEDRVSPTRIRERQTEKVRSRWHDVRNAVMGSSDDHGSQHGTSVSDQARSTMQGAQEAMHDARDTIQDAPHRAEEATRGNPLAAGLVAFGVGALAGSLFPASAPERRAAEELRDRFEEPVKDSLQQSGEELRAELQEHAEEAVEDTKQSAQQAADRVRGDAEDAAEQVQGRAEDAQRSVRSSS
jgi:ElaB/YqjD/DUF883 family membrane-anchored ribosome-binding protein